MGGESLQAGESAALVRQWIEYSATGMEALAVAIIVAVIVAATFAYLYLILLRRADWQTYADYRERVCRALLLGLEILVAADVIRTVALAPTLRNVLILGLLVVIRTFLSWTLTLEIEDRWPWQRASKKGREDLAVEQPVRGEVRTIAP